MNLMTILDYEPDDHTRCLYNTIAYLAKFSFRPLAASFHHTALLAVDSDHEAVACPNLHSHPGGNYIMLYMYNPITNPTPDMVQSEKL